MPGILSFADGFVIDAYDFYQSQVAASQSAAAIPVIAVRATNGSSLVLERQMLWPGSVIGLGAVLSAAAGAGTCSLKVALNGVAVAASQLNIDTAQRVRKTFDGQSLVRFAAGDRLSLQITTSAGWTGTTADLLATLYVLLEGVQP